MKTIPDLRPYAGTEEWISKPFTVVDARGKVWNTVTDRAWIAAVRGRGQYPRWKGSMAQLNIILSFIQSVQVEPRIVKTKVLKSWVSSGDLGVIMGVTLNLKRLGLLLNLISSPHIHIWDARSVTRQDPCLGMGLAPDFRMFLMGQVTKSHAKVFDALKFTTEPQSEKPTEPPSEGFDAFDLAMSLGDGSE